MTQEKKKPRTHTKKKLRPGCKENLKALNAALDRNEESDNEALTPEEYSPDGKTKPEALEVKKNRQEARKNFSLNTSDDVDFEQPQKDLAYYKDISNTLPSFCYFSNTLLLNISLEGYKRYNRECYFMQDK